MFDEEQMLLMHAKSKLSLRAWLHGAGMFRALNCMELGASYHVGTRKDNVTPEFAHQVEIAQYVRTISSSLMYPEDCICVSFTHDLREDYDLSDGEIREVGGDRVADATDRMTKKTRGVVRDEESLFIRMGQCPVASVVKPVDRFMNLQSMMGVFDLEKQMRYVEEGRRLFLPLAKQGKRNFPQQETAYENLKHVLKSQMNILDAVHYAAQVAIEAGAPSPVGPQR